MTGAPSVTGASSMPEQIFQDRLSKTDISRLLVVQLDPRLLVSVLTMGDGDGLGLQSSERESAHLDHLSRQRRATIGRLGPSLIPLSVEPPFLFPCVKQGAPKRQKMRIKA